MAGYKDAFSRAVFSCHKAGMRKQCCAAPTRFSNCHSWLPNLDEFDPLHRGLTSTVTRQSTSRSARQDCSYACQILKEHIGLQFGHILVVSVA